MRSGIVLTFLLLALTPPLFAADKSNNEISLREYVDVRIDALDKAVITALNAADRAVLKSEVASDKRFDSVNEFRESLNDQNRTLMPRAEAEQAMRGMAEKIDELTKRIAANEDRARGLGQGWSILVAAVMVVGTIITVVSLFQRARKNSGQT